MFAVDHDSNSTLSMVSSGIESLLAGIPFGITNSWSTGPQVYSQHYSSFVQDTYQAGDRLHLLFGVRWDITPATFANDLGYLPTYFQYTGYWNGVGTSPVQISSRGSYLRARWPFRYSQIAPRFGLGYNLKHQALVVRAGAGLFYDTGLGAIIANVNPLNLWQYAPSSVSPNVAGTPGASLPSPILFLPTVWEWKAAIDKSLPRQSVLSLSYIGSAGRRLLRNEATIDLQSSALQSLNFTSRGHSNYHALLTQLHANITPGLYVLASYSWSHSIDTGSSDTAPLLLDGSSNKGSSSFDVRHVFTASFGYRTPYRLGGILGGWTLSSTTQARTGFPFHVSTEDRSIGLGFENTGRADVVAGKPIWIHDDLVPGGRRLNADAFKKPKTGLNGSLGRNALTGAGLFQIDASLRRQFHLYRGSAVEASVSAFNLLNHPSFASPVSYLGSALFGQPASTTNLMLGTGSPTTGLTPLFQSGGPRTIELGLRFSF